MDLETALAQVVADLVDGDPNANGPFTKEAVGILADKYSLPSEILDGVRYLLNIGARSHKAERAWLAQNFKKARSQIKTISKLCIKLQNALSGLDDDTLCILELAGLAQEFAQSEEIMGLINRPTVAASPRIVRNTQHSGDETGWALDRPSAGTVSFEEIKTLLTHIDEAAKGSLKAAREGKRGKPEDDALLDLFLIAYQIWVNYVDQSFTLVWAKETWEPETAAAQWCVDIAHLVDPEATLENIDTVSRKVRERSIKISSLEKMKAFAENYPKRAGWAD
jgi:hypothetical protein